MLPRRAVPLFPHVRCRKACYSTARRFQPVQVLPDPGLETFRQHSFEPAVPALLPRQTFADLPAVGKWFVKRHFGYELNEGYLAPYGDTSVPLEVSSGGDGEGRGFERVEGRLGMFVEASSLPDASSIYLAQAPIPDLPPALQTDLPTPNLVLNAGKGDVYASSIWLGRAPTYTPLHRDPNPNLFVQLAGRKVVRLFRPTDGDKVFARVQEAIGGRASATMRGEEMMRGVEWEVLERAVWGDGEGGGVFEAEVESGDGLFVPRGWWHSVKGVGEGMTGSVNWWFR